MRGRTASTGEGAPKSRPTDRAPQQGRQRSGPFRGATRSEEHRAGGQTAAPPLMGRQGAPSFTLRLLNIIVSIVYSIIDPLPVLVVALKVLFGNLKALIRQCVRVDALAM